MRRHGFGRFPDPDSRGDLTIAMIEAAGINLKEPAVKPAADACASVTHGILTKAAVAQRWRIRTAPGTSRAPAAVDQQVAGQAPGQPIPANGTAWTCVVIETLSRETGRSVSHQISRPMTVAVDP